MAEFIDDNRAVIWTVDADEILLGKAGVATEEGAFIILHQLGAKVAAPALVLVKTSTPKHVARQSTRAMLHFSGANIGPSSVLTRTLMRNNATTGEVVLVLGLHRESRRTVWIVR